MRLLFVSSTVVGGSGRSQRELARRLVDRGHDVEFLVDDGRPARLTRWCYEQLSDLAARWGDRSGARVLRWLESVPGKHMTSIQIDGWDQGATPVPENAFISMVQCFQPDVVVGNSIIRLPWRKIRAESARRGIATVLYLREVTTYLHLEAMEDPADALVANAETLVEGAIERGHSCDFVPSVIDFEPTRVEPDRRTALFINPIASHGIELLWEVARRLPEIPFVVRESWPLSSEQLEVVERGLASLVNVEFERRAPPGPDLYRSARLLLVPHRVDNRPRVVAEAQANGIPVVASDLAGLREVVGPGGVLLRQTDVNAWTHAVERLWSDEDHYTHLSEQAIAHALRAEIRPSHIVDEFERVIAKAHVRAGIGAG